jgi:hypothetical protein
LGYPEVEAEEIGGVEEIEGEGLEGVLRWRSAARAISTATTTSSGGGMKDPLGVLEFL